MKLVLGFLALLAAGADLPADEVERDLGRECLALAGFAEARGDGETAMAAVMRVVLNRATDPAGRWPQSICDVALQPGQFLGIENWPYPRNPWITDRLNWERALAIADDAVADRIASLPHECGAATSFHKTRAGVTVADAGLSAVCVIGSQTFFVETVEYADAH